MMNVVESFIIPGLIFIIICASLKDKIKTFDVFSEGVKEGMSTVINLFPTLLALFLSINMLRASGIINYLSDIFGGILELVSIPKELTSLVFLKPISASSCMAIATDIFNQYGVDSILGLITSTILGATETTLYTLAIYTGAIKKKISKKLLIIAIFGNFLGILLSSIICKIIF